MKISQKPIGKDFIQITVCIRNIFDTQFRKDIYKRTYTEQGVP